MLHYRVKFEESFKDGNIFEKEINAGQVVVLPEDVFRKAKQSGAVMTQMDTLIPNPFKPVAEEEKAKVVEHDINLPVVSQEPDPEYMREKYNRYAKEDGDLVEPEQQPEQVEQPVEPEPISEEESEEEPRRRGRGRPRKGG